MPSKTPKQKKFMAAVANSPKFAKKVGVPQSVGKEFAAADKAKEDDERYDDRDPVDDDALDRARKEEKDLEGIEVDPDSVPTMTNVRKRVKDLDDKIKRTQLEVADKMQFKNFYRKRNG